jgi:hypothetical protein
MDRTTHARTTVTLTLELSPETVKKLREKAARAGLTLEAYLEQLAAESCAGGSVPTLSANEWAAQFRAWIASHKSLANPADDSRESIYEGRGE